MAIPEIVPGEGGNEAEKQARLKALFANAPEGAEEALRMLNEELGTGYPVPERQTESSDKNPQEEVPSVETVNNNRDLGDGRSVLDEPLETEGESGILNEDQPTQTVEVIDAETGKIEDVEVSAIPLDQNGHPVNQSHNRGQAIAFGLMQTKRMIFELIRESPETREMVQAVLQEKFEAEYLKASSRNDRMRVEALARQVADINLGLQNLTGKKVTLLGLYLSDPANPPITTTEGLFAYTKFHVEVARKILPASQIAGESADIEAKKALIPLRTELDIMKMQSDAEKAAQYIEIAPDLKEAARLRGQVIGENLSGILVPIFTSVPAAFFEVPKAVADRYAKWFEDSEDKGVPIFAVVGATGTTLLLISTGIVGAPLIAVGVGVTGGSIIGAAGWKGLKIVGGEAYNKLSGWWAEQKRLMDERAKQKKADKAAKEANKTAAQSGNSNPLFTGSSRK